ncbi:MAG: pyridoxal phosphate-dependent aminotransferase [Clostridia bacterium]|jgi:aspartate aminotransferase
MLLSSRVMNISPSMTLSVDAKAKKMKNEGIDVVGFGAGEPDFTTPQHIIDAAIDALHKGFTRYTPASGTRELQEAICEKLKRENGLEYTPSQIVVSNGAKHSLFNIFQVILNPGDEVIIPSPYWVSYPELVKMAGGIPVYVETKQEDSFRINVTEVEKKITAKTRAFILNSPRNPTGSICSEDELRSLADLAIHYNLFVISDEIYEQLVYDGEKHISIASLSKEIKKRTILVNGMSKAFAMTGWRIGYTASEEHLAKLMGSYQSHSTSNPNSIAQYASIAALRGPKNFVLNMVREFEKRRDYMVNRIMSIPGLSCYKPEGAFYIMMNIAGVLGKSFEGRPVMNSLDFTEMLLESQKTAVVPGIAFGADEYVRLSYATSIETIKKGMDRIESFIKDLR